MSKKKEEPKSYEAAYDELQLIVEQIEEGEVSVDDLAVKVKRASMLIEYCKNRLKSVEGDIDEFVKNRES